MSSSTGTLRDHLAVLNRHRGKMLLFFAGTMALVTLGIIICPRVYESEAKLHVLIGRESIAVDPTAATGQMINMMETREHEINTVRDLLRSRTVLEEVVDQIGADEILHPKKSADDAQGDGQSLLGVVYDWMLKINLADPVEKEERAARRLSDDCEISAEPNSSVIGLEFHSATPEMAQRIGEVFLDVYQAQHGKAHRTQGSQNFFERQSALLAEKLAAAEQRLRDVKNEHLIVTIAQSQATLGKEIELIEIDLMTTAVAVEAGRAKIEALVQSLEQIPDRLIIEETTESSLAADQMRKTFYDLQIQEKALSAKHTDAHPLVAAIRDQVAAAQTLLDSEEKRRTQPTTSLNPAAQQQTLALLAQQAVIEELEARHAALEERLSTLQQKLKVLNEQELTIAQLERDATLRREEFMAYTRNEELARLDEALESQSISNVNVVQPPTYAQKPVSPPKAILMVLGFLFGSAGAVGLALICDSLQSETQPARADAGAPRTAPVREPVPHLQGVRTVPK